MPSCTVLWATLPSTWRHGPCHGASATRPSTLLALTTNCNQSAPRFPLLGTCFWPQATSERFSVLLPPPRERPPPFPFTDFPLTSPSNTFCLLRGSDHFLLNSFPGTSTSTCAAQRPASATSAAAAATAAATTTAAEVSVGVGVARARVDDGGGGGAHGCVVVSSPSRHRRRRPAVHADDGALRARHARPPPPLPHHTRERATTDMTPLRSAPLRTAPHRTARLDSTRLDSTRLDSTRLDSAVDDRRKRWRGAWGGRGLDGRAAAALAAAAAYRNISF